MICSYEELCKEVELNSEKEMQYRMILLNCNKILEELLPVHNIKITDENIGDLKKIVLNLFKFKTKYMDIDELNDVKCFIDADMIELLQAAEEALILIS